MKNFSNVRQDENLPEFLVGGGEMGERIRSFDWSSTALGPVHTWPQSLRTCIRIMLTSRQPIWIGWGKDLIKFYNDPYKAIVGGKHPWALGEPASVVWKDIWHDIEPMLHKVMTEGEGTYVESQLLIMERNGYPEETYYTFSYTPIPGDDGKIAGMFCANSDDTSKIISERQLQTLTKLGRSLATCNNSEQVYENSIRIFGENPMDFPFALIRNIKGNFSELLYHTSFTSFEDKLVRKLDLTQDNILSNNIRQVLETGKPIHLTELRNNFGPLPSGGWPVSPDKAIVMPLFQGGNNVPTAVLAIGTNPYRVLDEQYLSFLQLAGDQISSALTGMEVLASERKRSETLAEIDKAKTVFFSNISHEFRTPLTLMLGSIEELIQEQSDHLDRDAITALDTMNRNAIRLLRLVNNLLDFSRIEAGRAKAHYQLTDLSKFTANLASTFRSIMEKAGLKLIVQCDEVVQPAYVDREMWEKIVLNLLSNAFKYTLQGEVRVNLSADKHQVTLTISDTGVGIPETELPSMFERFHRVENNSARSYEGTGIGLSLVSELVKLHQGEITVQSELGKGSAFMVKLPLGKSHLPSDQIVEKSEESDQLALPFIEEANLLLSEQPAKTRTEISRSSMARVLVVDDNADMREYFRRLLEKHYEVTIAANGMEALQKIRQSRPDLVVSDIMMPVLDGIQLVAEIKNNPGTVNLPVILVSARAGEEAKIEGYETGADDYLVKPFSAKELLARVRTQLKISLAREQALQSIYNAFDDVPFAVGVVRGPELYFDYINKYNLQLWQMKREDVIGKRLADIFPGQADEVLRRHEDIYRSGKRFVQKEVPVDLRLGGQTDTHYFDAVIDPLFNEDGIATGQLICSIDVTEQVKARQKIEASESLFRNILLQAPDPILILSGPDMVLTVANEPLFRVWNVDESAIGKKFLEILPEMEGQGYYEMLVDVYRNHKVIKGEESPAIFHERDGTSRTVYFNFSYQPYRDLNGIVTGVMVLATDVTQQVIARKKLQQSEERFRLLAETIPQIVWTTDAYGRTDFISNQWENYTGQSVTEALAGHRSMIHEQDRALLINDWEQSTQTGTGWKRDYRLYDHKTASYRWYTGSATPLTDNNGNIYKWIGTATDIHEQKIFANELERQVKARTLELQRSNEDLQQFAHVASHDLKEPVRKIKTFINRLETEYGDQIPDKGRTFISKAQNAAGRMGAMIEGVLNYSRAGSQELKFETVDLNEILQHAEADLEIVIQQKQAQVKAGNLGKVEAVPILFYQVFSNILSNSLKFSRSDVTPIIHFESSDVDVHGTIYKKIMIRDNGIGFEPGYAQKIFETFTRLHSKDQYEGTGLGLALCKKIVERHHGSITAGSDGKGATFEILLPVKQTDQI